MFTLLFRGQCHENERRCYHRYCRIADTLLWRTGENAFAQSIDRKVQGTCPVTTKKALQSIAQDSGPSIAYWRVVKANGELNTIFPGGSAGQAARLRKEGFAIEIKGNVMKVRDFRARLVRID